MHSLRQIYGDGREPIILSEYRRQNEPMTLALVTALIGNALVWYGSEHDISDEAGLMLARKIISNFYYLSLEDIQLAIEMHSAEHKYGRLNAGEVYNWICEYDKWRADNIESIVPKSDTNKEESEETMTEEEYVLTLQSMQLAGLAWAGQQLRIREQNKRKMEEKLASYKYQQEHKFDKKRKEDYLKTKTL